MLNIIMFTDCNGLLFHITKCLLFTNCRAISWNEAENICHSKGQSLFEPSDTSDHNLITIADYKNIRNSGDHQLGDILLIGVRKVTQVNML